MATDQEHACCLSCTLLASMEPVRGAARAMGNSAGHLSLPYPTTGSIIVRTERGRVLRIEELGPADESRSAV